MTTRAVFMNGRNASPQRNWCLLAVFQPTATKATASASSCAASLRGAMRSGEARGGRSRARSHEPGPCVGTPVPGVPRVGRCCAGASLAGSCRSGASVAVAMPGPWNWDDGLCRAAVKR